MIICVVKNLRILKFSWRTQTRKNLKKVSLKKTEKNKSVVVKNCCTCKICNFLSNQQKKRVKKSERTSVKHNRTEQQHTEHPSTEAHDSRISSSSPASSLSQIASLPPYYYKPRNREHRSISNGEWNFFLCVFFSFHSSKNDDPKKKRCVVKLNNKCAIVLCSFTNWHTTSDNWVSEWLIERTN